MFFHVLGHVESDQPVLVIEKKFCQGFGEFCFSYSSGTKHEEGPDRLVFFLKACTVSSNGVAH